MSELVNIDIQRTGFPIKIGKIELWFDSSLENLKKFFNMEEISQELLKDAQEKAQAIKLPKDVDAETMSIGTVNEAMDVQKTFLGVQFDIIFGDGTFDKLYNAYPDILALEQTFEIVGVAIADKLETMEIDRTISTAKKKTDFLAKKKIKKVGK